MNSARIRIHDTRSWANYAFFCTDPLSFSGRMSSHLSRRAERKALDSVCHTPKFVYVHLMSTDFLQILGRIEPLTQGLTSTSVPIQCIDHAFPTQVAF